MNAAYTHPESLVSTAWLTAHLADENLRVFECTTYLRYLPAGSDAPYTVESGRADYDTGHIAGAGFLDLQRDLSDNDAPPHLRFRMLPLGALARACAQQGIGDGMQVVLYSRGAPQWATRAWWMLRAIGFDRAAILDGGWEKWHQEERAVARDHTRFAPAKLTARPRPELFVDKDAVRAAIGDPKVCSINALTADLHRGENARYGRAGRIPGSTNVPAMSLIEKGSGTFVPPEVAAARLRDAGADPSKTTLLYCGGGIAATLDAFVLHQLGYTRLAVYDASMSEWARDETLPVDTG